ncbi:hypothetical protein [Amnibacterium endophyticum]|uniref:Uncharacterized protein n=1 Tax=Amnibacterium endophyticum TaxID=2109337 RepID=A0ABW4LFG2_9MICO
MTAEQLTEQLTAFATAGLVIGVLFAAALGLTAWRLRRGSGTARIWLIVLTVLSIAPLNVQALLVAVVLAVASVLTFRSSVTDWIRSRRP